MFIQFLLFQSHFHPVVGARPSSREQGPSRQKILFGHPSIHPSIGLFGQLGMQTGCIELLVTKLYSDLARGMRRRASGVIVIQVGCTATASPPVA